MIHRDGDEAAIADEVDENFQPGWHWAHLAEAQSKIDWLSGASPSLWTVPADPSAAASQAGGAEHSEGHDHAGAVGGSPTGT